MDGFPGSRLSKTIVNNFCTEYCQDRKNLGQDFNLKSQICNYSGLTYLSLIKNKFEFKIEATMEPLEKTKK